MEGRGSEQSGAQPENRQGMRIPDCKQSREGLLLGRLTRGNPHALVANASISDCVQTPHRGVCKSCRTLACPWRSLFCVHTNGCIDARGKANETAEHISAQRDWMQCVLTDARRGDSGFHFGRITNRYPVRSSFSSKSMQEKQNLSSSTDYLERLRVRHSTNHGPVQRGWLAFWWPDGASNPLRNGIPSVLAERREDIPDPGAD
jgi:hypothetical protein